jgi:hypothetical protein
MLTAVDSNGNSVDLGTVTSDSSGHFGFNWDSSTAGMYTIYATFAGSNSYYSSYAEASGVVASTPASSTTESASIATNADLANYLIIGIVAIIITIAIVGALLLRKKQ